MAIYLDANVLYPWLRFTELDRLAVSIVAHQLGQEVLIPAVAVLEAEEDLRRRLREELDKLEGAEESLRRITGEIVDVFTEPTPDVDGQVEMWRERLEEFATVLPLADEDAQQALRREIEGRRPARPREKGKHGAGGRDAAVWLTLLRDHGQRGEQGHLLSGDKKAFSDGKGSLHPELAREISQAGAKQVVYYENVASLIEQIGVQGPQRSLDLGALQSLAFDSIRSALRHSPLPPRALWIGVDPKLRYSTEVAKAELLEVLSQHRYVRGDQAVLAVNSRWHLEVSSLWQPRDTDQPGTWAGISGNGLDGELQLLIEEDAGELRAAELIGAELRSEAGLAMMGDGGVVSIG
jgi:PIN domain-containing protein